MGMPSARGGARNCQKALTDEQQSRVLELGHENNPVSSGEEELVIKTDVVSR